MGTKKNPGAHRVKQAVGIEVLLSMFAARGQFLITGAAWR